MDVVLKIIKDIEEKYNVVIEMESLKGGIKLIQLEGDDEIYEFNIRDYGYLSKENNKILFAKDIENTLALKK